MKHVTHTFLREGGKGGSCFWSLQRGCNCQIVRYLQLMHTHWPSTCRPPAALESSRDAFRGSKLRLLTYYQTVTMIGDADLSFFPALRWRCTPLTISSVIWWGFGCCLELPSYSNDRQIGHLVCLTIQACLAVQNGWMFFSLAENDTMPPFQFDLILLFMRCIVTISCVNRWAAVEEKLCNKR
jgi:hypothetical protein